MYKIAVMGDRESALGFMALGFSVFVVTERGSSNAGQTPHVAMSML